MALPASGSISLAQVATELGVSLPLDLNAANVRALAGKPSGNITLPNDLWGKSSYDGTVDMFDLGFASGSDYFNGSVSANGSDVGVISGLSAGTVVTLRFTATNVYLSASGQFGPSGASANASVGVERLTGPSGYSAVSAGWSTHQNIISKTFNITVQNGDQLRLFSSLSANAFDFGDGASGSFGCQIEVENLTVGQGMVSFGNVDLQCSNTGGIG